jgi:hypothetical protein
MTENSEQPDLQINGYTKEQALFALSELQKKTPKSTIHELLFEKFKLSDYRADNLISKVRDSVDDINDPFNKAHKEIQDSLVDSLVEKGVDRKTAEQMFNNAPKRIDHHEAASFNTNANYFSFFSVIAGLVLVFRLVRGIYHLINHQ